MTEINMLTVMHPFAWLIANGKKQYETRTWQPPRRMNEFGLHAGKKIPDMAYWNAAKLYFPELPERDNLPYGCVLGIATITNIYWARDIADTISDAEKIFGHWNDPGFLDKGWAWEIEMVDLFDSPPPAKGQQGIWKWEYNLGDLLNIVS